MKPNPLLPIWSAYSTSEGCFKIAKVALKHQDSVIFLNAAKFSLPNKTDTTQLIDTSRKEIKDLFVVDLWAAFERFVRDYLQDKASKLQQVYPASIGDSMYLYVEVEIEFWKPEDILEKILKNSLNPSSYLVGQAKQILQYRNWIAHGKNPNKTTAKITPEFAYKVLGEIIMIFNNMDFISCMLLIDGRSCIKLFANPSLYQQV